MSDLGINIIDNVPQQLAAREDEVRRSNLAMVSAIRQTAQAGVLVLQVAGVAINQIFSLYVESLIVGIEVALAIKGATFGLTQIFQIGQLIGMMILIQQIRAKQTAAAHKTNSAIQLMRAGTYRMFLVNPIVALVFIAGVLDILIRYRRLLS